MQKIILMLCTTFYASFALAQEVNTWNYWATHFFEHQEDEKVTEFLTFIDTPENLAETQIDVWISSASRRQNGIKYIHMYAFIYAE